MQNIVNSHWSFSCYFQIDVKLHRTWNAGQGWKPEFAVMAPSKILMSLQKADGQPETLQLFSPAGKVVRRYLPVCKHEVEQYLLAVEVGASEMLTSSCPHCQRITIMSLENGAFTEAYRGEWVGRMCHGGKNRIFVQGKKNEILQLQLDPVTMNFNKISTIHSGIQNRYNGLCYVPSRPRILIVADNSDKPKVRAIDCSKGDKGTPSILWTLSGEVDGKKISPESVVYSSKQDMVIVGDGINSRLLVLDGRKARMRTPYSYRK